MGTDNERPLSSVPRGPVLCADATLRAYSAEASSAAPASPSEAGFAAREGGKAGSTSWERDLLAAIGTGPIVVLGVGNRDRGDDGVGSIVAAELSHQLSVISNQAPPLMTDHCPLPAVASPKAGLITAVLDCGVAPENYLSRVAALRPRHVVFIDAADFAAAPGSIRLFKLSHKSSVVSDQCSCPLATDNSVHAVSTHAAGLELCAEYLRRACRSFDEAQDRPDCELTCWLLAVQPGDIGAGRTLSPAVREAASAIASSEVWRRSAAT